MKNFKLLMFLVTSVIVVCVFQMSVYANMRFYGDPGGWVNHDVSIRPFCDDSDHHPDNRTAYETYITVTNEGKTPVSISLRMYTNERKWYGKSYKSYFTEAASTIIKIDKTRPIMEKIIINEVDASKAADVYNKTVTLYPTYTDVNTPGKNIGDKSGNTTYDISGVTQTYQYSINGGAWTNKTGKVTISANGVYKVGFRARDAAGNYSEPIYTSFTIDSSVQDVTKISDHLGKFYNPQNSTPYTWKYKEPVTITAAGDTNPDSLGFEYRINYGPWIKGAIASMENDGIYLVEYRGVGQYGNYSDTKGVTVVIDRAGPSVTGSVYEDWKSVDSYNIDITVTDDFTEVKNVQYFVNGTAKDNGTNGTIKYTVSDEGETFFDVKATDEMGNEGIRNFTIRIDRTKPDMELTGNGKKLVPVEGEAFKFNKKVTVNAKAYDELSGIKTVRYRINKGNWVEGASMEINETGNWDVEFEAFDKAGNSITETIKFKMDLEAPEVTFEGANSIWSNEKSVTVSIYAKDSFSEVDKIEISYDEKEWVEKDKIEISEEGIITVYVRVSDLFGNTDLKTVIVKNDRTYPKLIIKDHDDKEIKSSIEPHKYNKKPTIFTLSSSDTLSGIEIIRYRINDGEWVEGDRIELGTSGNWKLEAEAIDRATNKTYSGIISVMLDVDAPQIDITGSDEVWKSVDGVLVSAEVSDAFSGVKSVEYSVDGSSWKTGKSVRIEDEKETHILFRAIDNFGNESTKEAIVRIDRSKPVLNLNNPGKNPVVSEEIKVVCLANDYLSGINNSSFRYSSDGETWLEGNTAFIKKEGTTKVTFQVDDNAGNRAEISEKVTIDRTPPTISDAYLKESKEDKSQKLPEGSYTDSNSLFLFVNAEDLCAGQKAEVSKYMYSVSLSPLKVNKNETEVLAKDDGGQYIPLERIEKGTNYIHVYAVDLAGNKSGCKVICIKVDRDYPQKPDIASTTHPYAKIPEDAVAARDAKFIVSAEKSGVLEVKEYRYSLYKGDKPLQKDQVSDSSLITFVGLEDNEPGEYYNLYVNLVGGNGRMTRDPSQYRFRIDSTPPKLLKITSGTHPVENQLYSKANASFMWNRPVDFTGGKNVLLQNREFKGQITARYS